MYIIILNYLFHFNCFSTKFQNIEIYEYYFQNLTELKLCFDYQSIVDPLAFDIINKSSNTFTHFCAYGIDSISLIFLILVSLIIPLVLIINWEQSIFPIFLLNNILFLEFCLLNLF